MENDAFQREVKIVFDQLARRLSLEAAVFSGRHLGFSFSYPGPLYGLEIEADLVDFFVMPLVYICDQNNRSALPTYRNSLGVRHKDYLVRVVKRAGLNLDSEFKQLQAMRGDYRKCRALCVALATLVERAWLEVVKCAPTQLLPD